MSGAGPLHPAFAPFAHAAAFAYGLGVRANAAWWGLRRPADAGVPVVSVGNVSAGGTGKTPFVRWCAAALREAGRSPAIAMRGYRASGGLADEAEECRWSMPGVPVAVGADRRAAIAAMRLGHPEVDCVVLDDGFQHRRLARELDVVLVDASRPAIDGALLPAGWLREPAHALRRAGLVVVTRAAAVGGPVADLVERHRGAPPDAWARHAWSGVVGFGPDGAEQAASVDGRRVSVACGLANPGAFVDAVRSRGAVVGAVHARRDHHAWTLGDVRALASACPSRAIVVPGKDWVKVRRFAGDPEVAAAGVTWLVPRVVIEFLAGESAVRAALERATGSAPRTPCG